MRVVGPNAFGMVNTDPEVGLLALFGGRMTDVLAGMKAWKRTVTERVRLVLVARQRDLGADGGIVMEGRDIATVVFPDAPWKFFMTARPEVRADRRMRELQAAGRPVVGSAPVGAEGTAAWLDELHRLCPDSPVHIDPPYWNAYTLSLPPADNRTVMAHAYVLMAGRHRGYQDLHPHCSLPLVPRRSASRSYYLTVLRCRLTSRVGQRPELRNKLLVLLM